MTPDELPAAYHGHVVKTVDPEGFGLAHGWLLGGNGQLTVMAMDLNPDQIYNAMLAQAHRLDAAAFIFAIDRFGKPGQGTKRADLLAGHYCERGSLLNSRPFIIEYDPKAGIVDPMNFDNLFWVDALRREMLAVVRQLLTS